MPTVDDLRGVRRTGTARAAGLRRGAPVARAVAPDPRRGSGGGSGRGGDDRGADIRPDLATPPETGSTGVTNPSPPTSIEPIERDPPLGYTFSVRSKGLRAIDAHTGRDYQAITLVDPARPPRQSADVATVIVYPPDGYRPIRPRRATPVAIGVNAGFAGAITPGPGMVDVSDGPALAALAWQYDRDAWAVVQWQGPVATSTTGRLDALRGLARDVVLTAPHAARLPASFGFLPARLRLASIDGYLQQNIRSTTVTFAARARAHVALSVEMSTGGESISSSGGHTGRPVAFGNYSGYYDAGCAVSRRSGWSLSRGMERPDRDRRSARASSNGWSQLAEP
jgi:hypothetical protein